MPSDTASDILSHLDTAAGGVHAGFRPVHARGVMLAGTFTPGPEAAGLTRAPHANQPVTAVTARFSLAPGVPTAADNDASASPQGLGLRFHLGEHAHTDIVAHSVNAFPARTGEEFLEFIQAAVASGPGAPNPPPIVAYLAAHPAARHFVETPKPLPVSYARQNYFAITAFRFTDAAGASRYGRFRIVPAAGTAFLTPEETAKKTTDFLAAELSERLTKGAVVFHVRVQMAAAGDDPADSTVIWPDTHPEIELGTITLTERVDELAPERRKIIFDPIPRVDGIESAGDPLTDVRSDIYLKSGRRRRENAAG